MSLEEIYDEKINPLMAQIIEICKENEIPFACQFMLDSEDDLACTSFMAFESERIKIVADKMKGEKPFAMAITIKNG